MVEAGVYTSSGHPDIIVVYAGSLRDDPEHKGPWIQWKLPWEGCELNTTMCFEFENMLRVGGYTLAVRRQEEPFKT